MKRNRTSSAGKEFASGTVGHGYNVVVVEEYSVF